MDTKEYRDSKAQADFNEEMKYAFEELSPDQLKAVEDFAEGLKDSFRSYRKNHPDNLSDIILDYVFQVIDIHLDLERLKFDRFVERQARYYGK